MLSSTRRFLLAPFCLLLALLGSAADAPERKPTPKQIAQWVEQLGDNDFKVRENASKKLWQAGAAAESALEKAGQSDDREMVRRARELLDKFRWGIYPDTPADVAALIRAYRSTAGNPSIEMFQKLLDGGDAGLRAAVKIAAAEKDENRRSALGNAIVNKLPDAYLHAVTEDNYETFERLLELGHENKFIQPRQYAAYWLLRGNLPERIARFTARLKTDPENKWLAETLAYLHRANGDLAAARAAAEKCDHPVLLEGILYELADWKTLAAVPNDGGMAKPAEKGMYYIRGSENPAERWAYRAAFTRLGGKPQEFEKALRELRNFTGNKDEYGFTTWFAAKGLLLNDRPTDGIELLRTVPNHRDALFDLLCARLDFAAALELAAKADLNDKEKDNPDLQFAHARLLCFLGDKEGEALFDRHAERIKDGVGPEWVESLVKEEMRAGLKDRAFAHAAKALSVAPPKGSKPTSGETRERLYFNKLFPQQAKTAEVWWIVLRLLFKDEPPAAVLKRLRQLMEGNGASQEVKKWIEQAEHLESHVVITKLSSWGQFEAWEVALAEAALLAGLDDLAVSLLEKMNRRDAFLRLGDLLAAKKQWIKAAESYQQAWKKELSRVIRRGPKDPLPLFLAGDALVRAGRQTDGKKRIEQAHRLPFDNVAARYNFLNALILRGHKEAARREAELLLRLSEPNSFYSGAATRYLAAGDLARKDFLKAAEGFEQSMLLCLKSNVNFVSHAAYVNVPAQVHQLRARGLLAAGKIEEARKEIELALADSPYYADLPIALVPDLEQRGYKKEATDLFNRCYGTIDKVCRAYPRCAWTHNSAAWIAACCRRNLDQALEHAQKAVALAPMHAGYHDTLGEVLFQRGDKDKAIAQQKRAIELDPKRKYFRKQLKRIEAGDPNAERPPENEE